MNNLTKIGSLLPTGLGRMTLIAGDCGAHGVAEVLVRGGGDWYCPTCLEQVKANEFATQWAAERNAALHKIASVPTRYQGERFVATTPAQKQVRAIAAAFRDTVVATPCWASLILMGDVGTGKTLLACEFAESWINRFSRSVRHVTAKAMVGEIQASYGREGKSEDSEIDRFVQSDLLILDEIDAISSKENAALLLTEVINRRYGNNRPMIIITNQPFEKLGDFVGDRVHDRLHENAFVCAFDWPSFRRIT